MLCFYCLGLDFMDSTVIRASHVALLSCPTVCLLLLLLL